MLGMILYVIAFSLYSWFLIKVGKTKAERKDTIKMTVTGKPEQVKEALRIINEQDLIK